MARPQRAAAQPEPQEPVYPRAQLSPLDLQDFPIMQAALDVYDPTGNFLHGLTPDNISIIENEQSLKPQTLSETAPGVQLVIAVTHGPAMGIRDGLGQSRYDYLLENLASWEAHPIADPPDDFSLIVEGGSEITHLNHPTQILAELQRFEVEPRQETPSLQVLNRAIEVALDPTDRQGMKRAILFITPPQPVEGTAGLQSLTSQAAQAGIRIYIWQVSAPEETETPPSRLLERMAAQTGGSFINYSGAEELPSLEAILEPLRYIYELSYRSAITSSGNLTVAVEVQHEDVVILSAPQSLEMVLLPPNPVFIALPSRIELAKSNTDTAETGEADSTPALSVPQQQNELTLKILIEFPDGHGRELTESALIVDGTVVDRNSSPPFDVFNWDLTPYEANGQHLVQVVVTDSIGLNGSSLPMPVDIIAEAEKSILASDNRIRLLGLAAASLLFLGALAVLGLVLGGKLQPYQFGKTIVGRARSAIPFARPRRSGPLTTDHASPGTGSRAAIERTLSNPSESPKPGWFRRITRTEVRTPQIARAFLTPTSESEASADEAPVPITNREVIFGSDPNQTTWTLHDPAIEPVHARLSMDGEQTVIYDEGTVAGTWVNYRPVPPEGCRLRHGDLVHIGSKSFRFKSSNPKDIRKLVILSQERSS